MASIGFPFKIKKKTKKKNKFSVSAQFFVFVHLRDYQL